MRLRIRADTFTMITPICMQVLTDISSHRDLGREQGRHGLVEVGHRVVTLRACHVHAWGFGHFA